MSKVINDRYGVAPDTFSRVKAVIAELGYESSLVARSLRSRRTNVIGILVADIEPFSAELLKGAAAAIRASDFELIVYSGSGHGKEHSGLGAAQRLPAQRHAHRRDHPRHPDGGRRRRRRPDRRRRPARRPVEHAQRPLRTTSPARSPPREYLIGLGHRRIGFLAGRPDLESARLREQGFRDALAAAGIALDPDLIRVGEYELEASEEPARQLLHARRAADRDLRRQRPVRHQDDARRPILGLSVPGDVSVIGFDNIPESALTEPPLTTIDQSIQQMGRGGGAAARRPASTGAADGPQQVTLPTKLVVRQSCRRLGRTLDERGRGRRRPTPPTGTRRGRSGERVADLLARMTLEEKVAQLGSAWVFQLADGAELDAERAADLLRHGLGQVTRISGASSLGARDAAALANAIQRHLVTETRLGIPAIVHEEICSGLMAREATIFPQAIGLASTWEPALAAALADAVRVQMRAMGAHQGLSPVLDVCRDPRWGRTEETFGEDPYLVARMGVAFVRGLQGDDPAAGVIATAKHFVGYGAVRGRDELGARRTSAPASCARCTSTRSRRRCGSAGLRLGDERLQRARRRARAPPTATCSPTVLRDEWGFDGCVVADYFSIRQLADYHHLAVDAEEAAAMALDAGLDVELPGTDCYGAPLLQAVRSGRVSEPTVDTAVAPGPQGEVRARPVRAAARRTGSGRPRSPTRRPTAGSPARSPRKSLVLLRNDGVLPLRPDVGSVAVIGPNADDARQPARRLHLPGARRVAAGGAEAAGATCSRCRSTTATRSTAIDADATTVARRAPGAARAERVGFARGCDVNSASRDGFAEAVALAAGVRRRGAGDGRQGRAHRRLHERREPRRRVARPARACRRTSSAR